MLLHRQLQGRPAANDSVQIYKASFYDDITPVKVAINETVPTAADVRLPSLAFCRQHTTL